MIYPDPSSAAANAVVNWIAGAASKSHKYTIDGYTVTFRAHKSYGIIGIVSTAVGIASLLFVPDRIAGLVLGGIFGILGVLIALYSFVMKVSLSPDRIAYRGPFGRKKQLLWDDVKSISTVSAQGDIMLSGPYGRVRIFAYLAGFSDLKKLIRLRFPLEAAASPSSEMAGGDSATFRLKRLSAVIGIIGVLLAAGGLWAFGPISSPQELFLPLLVLAYLVFSLLLVLYGLVTRLYIDNTKLIYHDLFGRDKLLRWEEIETVSFGGLPQNEMLKLSGNGVRMRIRIDFRDYFAIKELVLSRCPESARPFIPPAIS